MNEVCYTVKEEIAESEGEENKEWKWLTSEEFKFLAFIEITEQVLVLMRREISR